MMLENRSFWDHYHDDRSWDYIINLVKINQQFDNPPKTTKTMGSVSSHSLLERYPSRTGQFKNNLFDGIDKIKCRLRIVHKI